MLCFWRIKTGKRQLLQGEAIKEPAGPKVWVVFAG